MDFPVTLVSLAGAVALLLWGTHMVQTGVQRAFGPKLRAALGAALKNRLLAFFAGMGVTAAVQSSTATGLMAAGFVAGGFVDLVPALAVMLGANVGTTLIVQLFSFDVSAFSPALVLVGVMMFRRGSNPVTHDLGRVFIGFGLMLLALHQLLELTAPYEDAPSLRLLLGAVSTVPLLAVLLTAAATFAMHSSVAVVLLVMSLAARGVVPPEAAFAMILGANLGTAINPVLEGPSGNDPSLRRLPVGNLLNRAIGVAIGLALLHPISVLMVTLEPDNARAAANFHTFFNLALAAVFFPLLTPYAALLRRLMPTRIDPADPSRPLYLDNSARETPIVALGAAAREALRLVDALEAMLNGAIDALVQGDRKQIAGMKRLDDILDRLNTAIKAYLATLDHDELSQTDHRRMAEILAFATNMEQAGDVVDRSLLPHAAKRAKRGLSLPKASEAEIKTLMDRLIANLRAAAALLMTEDPRAARLLAAEKAAFRDAESAATRAHFEDMRMGRLGAIETSALYLDLLRDMKLINSHIVAAAAYPVLERTGDLLPSRLATNGD
ncbi:Na/Pi-cotransporter II-related protein [Methylocella silvestris BL2]|uniref:Na/Pi-cotransporter II-related protein n=1 Tax=Methylocella silvestris (strain DSM 15510 / CIP 108128 / LMG 27833 / NCIMB 13906 / BL2) TaxID=395965 RepID=B8ELV7_METSB|nr:Na/Pi cotransporter family protein [Methylocella silvestris]ACK50738.1 Na/Pi-cotransporter II-related protein [Methylocella silvestris BL2]